MLIISRKKDQKIIVADDIEITILEVGRNRVRFGVKAPKHIPIHTRVKTASDTAETASPITTETPKAEHTAPVQDFPIAVGMTKRR